MSSRASGVDSESIDRLGAELSAAGLEGMLVLAPSSRDGDLAPFVGDVQLGECFVIATAAGRVALGFLTDMEREEAAATGMDLLSPARLRLAELKGLERVPGRHWSGVLARAFAELEIAPGAWGVAGHPPAGTAVEACSALAADGWRFAAGGEILRRWRRFKPAAWRERMAAPAAGVCAAMRRVAALLAAAAPRAGELELDGEPLRVGRLREAARVELARHGLWEPEGDIFAAGSAAGVPHSRGDSSHVLRPGEPLVVDLFPRGWLFADCTRTFCVGEPSPEFRRAHASVLGALRAAHEGCRPGVAGWALQERACAALEALGYPTARSTPDTRRGYVHGLGHGVGFELHEYPSFREAAGDEGVLAVGDLVTLEPGLYDPDAGWGVRLEDLCYLGAGGLVNLTPLPYAWDPAAWAAAVAPASAAG
ncbi:MAG: aminopeptidase P family protein [Acidobacteriota bacterium]|nr:aminopeptidase P family protein [Acidobacteriota bacterium]MDH3525229.1 aminopeptidase P family protein [Acidobacteriota bacterium]